MGEEPFDNTQKPPIFKTWGQFYLFVLVFHVVIVVLFYWFKEAYA